MATDINKIEDINYLINNYEEPIVFKNIVNWKLFNWTLEDWKNTLGGTELSFRKIKFERKDDPLFESLCDTVSMTMQQFIDFQSNNDNMYSLYFDYKHLELLKDTSEKWFYVKNEVSWPFPVTKNESGSTIWIGSKGAHTPCHMDTYGCNVVTQVFGRKEWILFPPEADLSATRVPYEESTVYSQHNFQFPEVDILKDIPGARTIILEPGDTLYLPPSWWHYVENLDTAISINIWLPRLTDEKKRIEEALVMLLIRQMTVDMDSFTRNKFVQKNMHHIYDEPMFGNVSVLLNALDAYNSIIDKSKGLSINRSNYNMEKVKRRKTEYGITDIKDIIDSCSDYSVLPTLSREEFIKLIEEKTKRYKSKSKDIAPFSPEPAAHKALRCMINTFCNPQHLSRFADTYLRNMDYRQTAKPSEEECC